jgi:TetR/AcrR family transcriptional regulator, regulator of cefoperazone and chloramphenicol sensitivity
MVRASQLKPARTRAVRPTAEPTRGELARQSLIEAGVAVFGEHSLHSASTREIARRAGQNIAAIAYYFGGKEGLYHAVVQHIADIIDARIGPLMDEINSYLAKGQPAPERCLDYMGQLLASTLATHTDMLPVTSIIIKEQMQPTPAFSILYDGALGQLQATGAALLEAYCGLPADAQETVVRFHALLGQSLVFRFARQTIIRRAGWRDIAAAQERLIREAVIEQTQAAMRSLRRQAQKKTPARAPT